MILRNFEDEGNVIISSSSSTLLWLMTMTRVKEDKEVRRPEHGKLAVLTGVISRSTIVIGLDLIIFTRIVVFILTVGLILK